MMDVPILGYSDVNLSPKKSDRCVSDVSFIFSIKLILSHYFFVQDLLPIYGNLL